jgi:hypothetical protein
LVSQQMGVMAQFGGRRLGRKNNLNVVVRFVFQYNKNST